MLGEPDAWYRPRPWLRRACEEVCDAPKQASGRYAHEHRERPTEWPLDFATPSGWWVPVATNGDRKAQALAVWWTPPQRASSCCHRRAQTLTYPTWQLQHLREVRIPKPESLGWHTLTEAWKQVRDLDLLADARPR